MFRRIPSTSTDVRAVRSTIYCRWRPHSLNPASCTSQSLQLLCDWVLESGGYMHPSLAVTESAPCGGGRGLLCKHDVKGDDIVGMPMLLVPEDIILTSEVARHGFATHYEAKGAQSLSEVDEATQLAIMLAHERIDGDDSFYAPYINALTDSAPCAWALDSDGLQQALLPLQPKLGEQGVEEWREVVVKYRRAMEQHSEGAADRYNAYFNLTPDAFFWAMGQVLSRSFSSHSSLALLPLIDMCNHKAECDHPDMIAVGGDESDQCACVSSISSDGTWQELEAGQELFIRYFDSPKSATNQVLVLNQSSNHFRVPTLQADKLPDINLKQGVTSIGDGSIDRNGKQTLISNCSAAANISLMNLFSENSAGRASTSQIREQRALLCFLSHGHVFPELWSTKET
ncbi:hypothetical protein CEUSTIGMA_g2962.t1 [Chlamydomonas eustigma]|uniref:SET domain-containing protein n=1 Tax=Chlamydomonas eustigma TaxID=1157962 RepID=A0A250WXV2_9CHLO|nr:hypothetical protein CEUSTIGMA_g2962.t1 [Chlamydomonas eustigma]|eukprot:GAX75519.1 hypothetical protein CEUSTIGMA_g2962.t1 [Chlamydomonas eustigma]